MLSRKSISQIRDFIGKDKENISSSNKVCITDITFFTRISAKKFPKTRATLVPLVRGIGKWRQAYLESHPSAPTHVVVLERYYNYLENLSGELMVLLDTPKLSLDEKNRLNQIMQTVMYELSSLVQTEDHIKNIYEEHHMADGLKRSLERVPAEALLAFEERVAEKVCTSEKDLLNKTELAEDLKEVLGVPFDIKGISFFNNHVYKIDEDPDVAESSVSKHSVSLTRIEVNADTREVVRRIKEANLSHHLARRFAVRELVTNDRDANYNPIVCQYELTQWCEMGNMERIAIQSRTENSLEAHLKNVIRYAEKMVRLVKECHEIGVIFPDIKPSNILLDNSDQARLSDYKTLFTCDANCVSWNKWGENTAAYEAPEKIFFPDYPEYSRECVDIDKLQVYMLGISLYQMAMGLPGAELPEMDLVEKRRILNFQDPIFETIDGMFLRDLIKHMELSDPKARFSLSDTLKRLQVYLNIDMNMHAEENELEEAYVFKAAHSKKPEGFFKVEKKTRAPLSNYTFPRIP